MSGENLLTPCREWQGARTSNGYGERVVGSTTRRVRDERGRITGVEGTPGQMVYVHRWVWEQVHGPIPPGMHVLHACDNPPCFRYDHLFLGTHAQNMADMKAKRRGRKPAAPPEYCTNGHLMAEHGYIRPDGRRECRLCATRRKARYRDRKRGA